MEVEVEVPEGEPDGTEEDAENKMQCLAERRRLLKFAMRQYRGALQNSKKKQ